MNSINLLARCGAVIGILVVGIASVTATPQTSSSLSAFQLPDSQQSQAMAVSPDGTQVVYVANNRLYLKGAGDPQAIAGTESPQALANPVFSPDGQSIAFFSAADQALKRISVKGGSPVAICKAGSPFGMSWAANDQVFFAQFGGAARGVMRVPAGGGTPETVVTLEANQIALTPQLLPGNETLLFTLGTLPAQGPASPVEILARAQVVTQSLSSRERKVLLTGGNDARYVPSGHIVYMTGAKLMAVPFNLTQLAVNGPAVLLLDQVAGAGQIGTTQFSFSQSGTLSYIPGTAQETQLAFVDLKGSRKSIGSYPPTVFAPRVAPNGKQLTIDTNIGAESAIWLVDLSGDTGMRRFTPQGENHFPMWSGDGERLIFISVRQGQPALYWQRADGTGAAERLTEISRAPESFSIQNEMMSYITLSNDGDYDVWTYSFRDKKSAPLIEKKSSAQHSSRFSPDGKWIAFVSDETGRLETYVQPFPSNGTRVQVTRNGGGHPLWSPDGKTLYFDNDHKLFSVAVQTQSAFTASDPKLLPISGFMQGAGNYRRQYDITPDGSQFIMMFPATQEIRRVQNWFDDLKRRVPPLN